MTLTLAVLRELRPKARPFGPLFCRRCGVEARRLWDCRGVAQDLHAICLSCLRDEAGEWSFVLAALREERVRRRLLEAKQKRRTG